MEYRQLGRSGLRVSTLTLGTATFGGGGALGLWGNTDVAGARRLIDLCLDAGINMLDTADMYSAGRSEEIVGEALQGRRDRMLVATKARRPMGDGPNSGGLSRHHLIAACEASLRRLRVDHIDLYLMHGWDGQTPLEETLEALDTLVRSGKVRYIGCSNYSGWHLVKAMSVAAQHGYQPFVAQQIYLSLQARDAELEVIPAAIDQGVGNLVWSPLAGGLLSGKYRRGVQPDGTSRHLTRTGTSRRSTTRTRCTTRSRSWCASPTRVVRRCRRWRWRGCWPGRVSRRSSSARGTRSSSSRTSAPPTWC